MGFHIAVVSFGKYPEIDTYADLPAANLYEGLTYLVRFTTGTIFVNRKRAGLWYSDGTAWARLGQILVAGGESPSAGFLPSNPPIGKCVVTNIYVDPSTDKVKVLYENIPVE